MTGLIIIIIVIIIILIVVAVVSAISTDSVFRQSPPVPYSSSAAVDGQDCLRMMRSAISNKAVRSVPRRPATNQSYGERSSLWLDPIRKVIAARCHDVGVETSFRSCRNYADRQMILLGSSSPPAS